MKLYLILSILIISASLRAEVFIDPTIRPCDPKIAATWKYTPTPVTAPGSPKMPFECEGDVKVFRVTAEIVMSTFDKSYEPGPVYTWGYNGSNPGPVMEMLQGEKIKVIFTNKLPEPSVLHWHGLEVPFNQDGAEGHSQLSVKPGETYVYEWVPEQAGTFMYHSGQNLAKQLSMGLVGFLIVHPKKTPETLVDHDFLYFLQMYALPPHSIFPDVMEMVMFNYFTFNGKSSPDTPSPLVYVGQKARIRFANMSMMEHPVHLHGHTWRVVATGAGDNPASTHILGNTILVPTAQTMDVIIDEIDTPGEWMFHCHLPHHVTNNMDVNIIPGEPMYMKNGGMHSVLRVYKGPNNPGYVNPNPPETETDPNDPHGGGHGGGQGGATPLITTYDGRLNLSNGNKVDISLELFKAQEKDEWRKLKAFLKVYLTKDEFIVYEYEQVKFNFETGLLSLESDEKSLTLSNLIYKADGDLSKLSGEASVDFGSLKGTVELFPRDPEASTIRLKNELSVSGEFNGMCGPKKTFLQLLAAREFTDGERSGNNPLPRFAFKGSIGVEAGTQVQVEGFVKESYYDPYNGELSLKMDYAGTIKAMTCKPTLKQGKVTGLDCGDCQLKKVSSLTSSVKPASNPEVKFIPDASPKVTELTDATDLKGNFFGALVTNDSKLVIPMNLKIVAKRYALNSMVITKNQVSGVIDLGMGSSKLTYKMKERKFLDSSSVVNQGRNLLLFETTGQISLVINKWTKKSISGEAYHSSYGSIGKFQVNKDADVLPVVDPKLLKALPFIDGTYKGQDWVLSLTSSPDENEKSNTVYAPLHVKGTLKKGNGGPLLTISGGTFDFLLGVAYLETDDGRILKASLNHEELELFMISKPQRRTKYLNLGQSRLTLKRGNP